MMSRQVFWSEQAEDDDLEELAALVEARTIELENVRAQLIEARREASRFAESQLAFAEVLASERAERKAAHLRSVLGTVERWATRLALGAWKTHVQEFQARLRARRC